MSDTAALVPADPAPSSVRPEHLRAPGHSRPLSRPEMLARVARFRERTADPGAFPDLQAQGGKRNVAYVVSPQGLGGKAPIEQPHGFHLSISQLSPGVRPTVHSHPYTEVFMPLDQPFRLLWGETLEQSIDLEPFDVASVPAGVFRTFENVGAGDGHMLAIFDHGGDPHTGIVVPAEVFEKFYRNWNPGMVGIQGLSTAMLIDLGAYTLHPGKLQVFLARFEREGLPLQTKHCGNLIGSFVSETGTLNQLVQLRAYADAADYLSRRAALFADPDWQRFGDFALPLIARQENRLLKPTAFSPRAWAPQADDTKGPSR